MGVATRPAADPRGNISRLQDDGCEVGCAGRSVRSWLLAVERYAVRWDEDRLLADPTAESVLNACVENAGHAFHVGRSALVVGVDNDGTRNDTAAPKG